MFSDTPCSNNHLLAKSIELYFSIRLSEFKSTLQIAKFWLVVCVTPTLLCILFSFGVFHSKFDKLLF